MRTPDLEQILLAMLSPGPGLFPYWRGQGACSVGSGTRHLHAGIAVGFVVVAKVQEFESAEDCARSGGQRHVVGAAVAGHDDNFNIVLGAHLASGDQHIEGIPHSLGAGCRASHGSVQPRTLKRGVRKSSEQSEAAGSVDEDRLRAEDLGCQAQGFKTTAATAYRRAWQDEFFTGDLF